MRDGQKILLALPLRSNRTDVEQRLWRHPRLKQLAGHRFRRQHPIGPYVADLACLQAILVIEVDGGQHAQSRGGIERNTSPACHGFKVLRFWNNDVLQNTIGVVEAIMKHLDHGHPHPGLAPRPSLHQRRGRSAARAPVARKPCGIAQQAGEGAQLRPRPWPRAVEGVGLGSGLLRQAGKGAGQEFGQGPQAWEGAGQGTGRVLHAGPGAGRGGVGIEKGHEPLEAEQP